MKKAAGTRTGSSVRDSSELSTRKYAAHPRGTLPDSPSLNPEFESGWRSRAGFYEWRSRPISADRETTRPAQGADVRGYGSGEEPTVRACTPTWPRGGDRVARVVRSMMREWTWSPASHGPGATADLARPDAVGGCPTSSPGFSLRVLARSGRRHHLPSDWVGLGFPREVIDCHTRGRPRIAMDETLLPKSPTSRWHTHCCCVHLSPPLCPHSLVHSSLSAYV